MSRTFRRKSIPKKLVGVFGYVWDEHRVCNYSGELFWQRPRYRYPDLVFDCYEDYLEWAYRRFYGDCGNEVVVSYNKAPWYYRNKRNRALRMKHKEQIHRTLTSGDDDVVIDEFKRTAGWDYW